jgi:hypothetical protein
MLISNQPKKIIKLELTRGDFQFNFSNSFDQQSREFEDSKIRSKAHDIFSLNDDDGILRELPWANLSYWQSYHFLDNQENPFYFLQMTNRKTFNHYQIVVSVEISRVELFQIGTVHQWIMSSEVESTTDQHELLSQLNYFCRHHTNLMSLRIQPYMPGKKSLESTYNLLTPLGFADVSPKSIIKTRMIDLRPPTEEILSSFSGNGRARLKIKNKDDDLVEVKEIFDIMTIPFLQNALNASYTRSTDKKCPYSFIPLLISAAKRVHEVLILGFFFKDNENVPLAFITGINHGGVIEYSVGGSLSDSKLRHFPFNHILMWQLVLRSKQNGAHLLDMSGITSGTDDDALKGITNFKRLFPGFELTVGREMEIAFRPKLIFLYSMIRTSLKKLTFK